MAVDPAERLLNLIIALTHARVRMTRAQIRSSVVGYEPALAGASAEDARKREAAFERMFERDKDELRRMGIPLRTVIDPTHGDEIGYKIDASDAAMPAIDFTAAEAAALAVAAEYWQGAVLDQDAQRGLTKIASAAAVAPVPAVDLGARTTAASDAMAIIIDARAKRQAIQFEYASETSGLTTRTVEPWVIVVRGPAEYLHGMDRDRGEPRTFRLKRIQGQVRPFGQEGAYEIPSPLPAWGSGELPPVRKAVIGVKPESGYGLRERGVPVASAGQWDLLEVDFRYVDGLADDVLRLAGNAKVVSPPEVATEVTRNAQAALDAALASLEGTGGANG